jgi:diguanylate cyclase (GGDEF)-like protein
MPRFTPWQELPVNPPSTPSRYALARMLGLQTVAEHAGGPPALRTADETDMRDALTGLPDARYLRRAFSAAVMWALRTNEALSFALLRLDGLALLGGVGGATLVDHVVIAAAHRLRSSFRASDVLARWSEHEFIVLFPQTTTGGAVRAAEKAMWAFHSEPFFDLDQNPFEVNWSASIVPIEPAAPFMEAVGTAERLLDEAEPGGGAMIHWPDGRLAPFSRRIAVVSTDPACCRLAKSLAGQPGDEFVAVAEPSEAVELIERALPKLVVLDLEPDPECALEVLHQLRQTSAASGMPVVVTASDAGLLPRVFDLGADEFLLRPLRADEFRARAERLLRRRARLSLGSAAPSLVSDYTPWK